MENQGPDFFDSKVLLECILIGVDWDVRPALNAIQTVSIRDLARNPLDRPAEYCVSFGFDLLDALSLKHLNLMIGLSRDSGELIVGGHAARVESVNIKGKKAEVVFVRAKLSKADKAAAREQLAGQWTAREIKSEHIAPLLA